MYQCGILQLLVDLSLTSNAPQRVKASAFYALAELIRLNKVNQDTLSKAIIIPAHPPVVPLEDASTALTPPGRSSAQFSRSSFQSGRGERVSQSHRSQEPRERCPAIVEVVAIAVGQYPGCTYSVRAAATCLFQVPFYLSLSLSKRYRVLDTDRFVLNHTFLDGNQIVICVG